MHSVYDLRSFDAAVQLRFFPLARETNLFKSEVRGLGYELTPNAVYSFTCPVYSDFQS